MAFGLTKDENCIVLTPESISRSRVSIFISVGIKSVTFWNPSLVPTSTNSILRGM
ncbi:hypothetical protein SDC9_153774 [bioreactor metagenome]|uniref:Uncharacterized protein n=1 Tax=bioreactor metagenome TaxID=1076179 RepID=A0A645EWU5_9ZZZZ